MKKVIAFLFWVGILNAQVGSMVGLDFSLRREFPRITRGGAFEGGSSKIQELPSCQAAAALSFKQKISKSSFLNFNIGFTSYSSMKFGNSVLLAEYESGMFFGDIIYQSPFLENKNGNLFFLLGTRFGVSFSSLQANFTGTLDNELANIYWEENKGVFPLLLLGIGKQWQLGKFVLEGYAFYQKGFTSSTGGYVEIAGSKYISWENLGDGLGIGAKVYYGLK